jgi:TatD DNase family protein
LAVSSGTIATSQIPLSSMLVDIGANLTHPAFEADFEAVLERAAAAGVERMIVTGTSVTESAHARTIAAAHAGRLYCTAGIHPHHAGDYDSASIPALRAIAADPEVVAIGECGLDFNRNYSPHPAQEDCFLAQLDLAIELGKPVFLHARDAHPRMAQLLGTRRDRLPRCVAHCFTGERDEMRAYLDLGLYIGITGWICDERRGRHLIELVRDIPGDRLMIETDAPYLTPRDMRPQPRGRRNEPAFLTHVAHAVARARGEQFDALAQTSTRNASAFFGLPG